MSHHYSSRELAFPGGTRASTSPASTHFPSHRGEGLHRHHQPLSAGWPVRAARPAWAILTTAIRAPEPNLCSFACSRLSARPPISPNSTESEADPSTQRAPRAAKPPLGLNGGDRGAPVKLIQGLFRTIERPTSPPTAPPDYSANANKVSSKGVGHKVGVELPGKPARDPSTIDAAE